MKGSNLIQATRNALKKLIVFNARELAKFYGDDSKAVELTDDDFGVTPMVNIEVESASGNQTWMEKRYVRNVDVSETDDVSIGIESGDDISREYISCEKLSSEELAVIADCIESSYLTKKAYNG